MSAFGEVRPPGFLCYAQYIAETRGAMAMVSTSDFGLDEKWRGYLHLELSIAAPFNSEFKDHYNSIAYGYCV